MVPCCQGAVHVYIVHAMRVLFDEGEEVCVWVDIERKVRVSKRGRGLFCIDQIYRVVDCEIKTLSSKISNVP